MKLSSEVKAAGRTGGAVGTDGRRGHAVGMVRQRENVVRLLGDEQMR